MEKEVKFSEKEMAVKAVDFTEATLAEISALVGQEIKSGTIVSLMRKGIVESAGERVIECAHCGAKRKVKTYSKVA